MLKSDSFLSCFTAARRETQTHSVSRVIPDPSLLDIRAPA
jgi:hypothetical protein